MFKSILNDATGTLSIMDALICLAISLALGVVIALVYKFQSKHSTKNLLISLLVLPAIVQIVIMMVNGNLGVGIAVLGAFSLVRFRSLPGSSKDISFIFFAMAVGLATGMGYLTFALAVTIVLGAVLFIVTKIPMFSESGIEKRLKIDIPDDLNYSNCFDDIFNKYLKKYNLETVKTINLGTMYELHYNVIITDETKEKEMIDEIRCRNGNLPIIYGIKPINTELL